MTKSQRYNNNKENKIEDKNEKINNNGKQVKTFDKI